MVEVVCGRFLDLLLVQAAQNPAVSVVAKREALKGARDQVLDAYAV